MPTSPAPDPAALVEAVLERHGARGSRIAVGLSGGVDSVLLADILHGLAGPMSLSLSAVHVNHGLSPNAHDWAGHCRQFCAERGIALAVHDVAVDRHARGGLENAAREARYGVFAGVDAGFIALAHHADDQAETVLHQLLRGTGLSGLAGMGESRRLPCGQTLLRPLLEATRQEIVAMASHRGLRWIEDESNDDLSLTRNYLRREVLPRIGGRFPHYRASLARAARHAADAHDMLSELAALDLGWDGREARATMLDTLPVARQANALYHWLRWQGVTPPGEEQLTEWARQLFRASPRDRPHRAGGHGLLIRRRGDLLALERVP